MILQLGMPKLIGRTSDTKPPKPVGVVEGPQRRASRSPDRPEALRLSFLCKCVTWRYSDARQIVKVHARRIESLMSSRVAQGLATRAARRGDRADPR